MRAGGRCEVTPGCPRRATTADHIVSAWALAQTGRLDEFVAVENLRAACRTCNSRRGAVERNARARGRPRGRRVDAEAAAVAWAARENAYWVRVEVAAGRPAPQPRIY